MNVRSWQKPPFARSGADNPHRAHPGRRAASGSFPIAEGQLSEMLAVTDGVSSGCAGALQNIEVTAASYSRAVSYFYV
jgi:hypothetical protein